MKSSTLGIFLLFFAIAALLSGLDWVGVVFIALGLGLLFFYKEAEEVPVQYAARRAAPFPAPIVIEAPHEQPQGRGSQLYQTQNIRLQVKPKWQGKMWMKRPQHYFFYHTGKALDFIGRSLLYVLGAEKDKESE